MSQNVRVQTVVQGFAGLIQAIVETGLEYVETKRHVAADGKQHAVDLVVTDEQGTQVGVKVDAKSGTATFVGHEGKDKRVTALANRIAQRYAYSRVTEELKRKGYQIGKEEKQKDGSIKLVAQRWK